MTDKAISPLRQRMIEDMTIRKLAPKTQHNYVQRVKNFAAFLGRSPDMADFETESGCQRAKAALLTHLGNRTTWQRLVHRSAKASLTTRVDLSQMKRWRTAYVFFT